MIPVLPGEIAGLLPDGSPGEDAANDAVVAAFIAEHQNADRPDILNGLKAALISKIESGESRHNSAVSTVTGVLKEARAGYYPAELVIDELKPIFVNAVMIGDKKRTANEAENEWNSIVAWGVGQALGADLDEVRARVDNKMPNNTEFDPGNPGGRGEPDGAAPRLWAASDLKPAAQPRWLAKNRLQRAAINLLIGDEGIGKSLLWVYIAAAVTTGKPLPTFGIPKRSPAPVILVCTEDDWATTVRPRLEVAGADLAMVYVICTEDDGSGAPVFPRDLHLIAQADPPPALVVVDAWLDTVSAGLSVRDPQQARQALHPWREVATATDAAVLLLCHTNRVASANARDRYGATGELRKKARMTLYAQTGDDGQLVVGPEKMNTAAPIPASMFTITPVQHFRPTEDSDGTVPLLVYAGESEMTAREHLAASAEAGDEPGGNPAKAFVYDYVFRNGGEAAASDVLKAARAAGFSEQEIKDARRRHSKPRIESRKASFGDGWVWAIGDNQDGNPNQGGNQQPEGGEDGTEGDVPPIFTPSPPSPPSPPSASVIPGGLADQAQSQTDRAEAPSAKTAAAASGAQNDAYRAGLCVDCHTNPYAPGRPRCDDCHSKARMPA